MVMRRDTEGDKEFRIRLRRHIMAFLYPSVFLLVFSFIIMLFPIELMPTKWRAVPVFVVSVFVFIVSVILFLINNARLVEIENMSNSIEK